MRIEVLLASNPSQLSDEQIEALVSRIRSRMLKTCGFDAEDAAI